VTGFRKHGHELWGSIKCGEFLGQLRNWQRLTKHCEQAQVIKPSLRCEQFSRRWIAQHPAVSSRTGTGVKENHEMPRLAGRTLRTLRTRSVKGQNLRPRSWHRSLSQELSWRLRPRAPKWRHNTGFSASYGRHYELSFPPGSHSANLTGVSIYFRFTKQLLNASDQSSSSSASHQIPQAHCLFHNSPSLNAKLSQLYPVHALTSDSRSILILSSNLDVGLQSGLFTSGFPTKTLYADLHNQIYSPQVQYFYLLVTIYFNILSLQGRSA